MSDNYLTRIEKDLKKISSKNELMNVKSKYLGKKGEITLLTNSLKDLSIKDRKTEGAKINKTKKQIESLLEDKLNEIQNKLINNKLNEERIDVTLPSRGASFGSVHPISQVLQEVTKIFRDFGFEIAEGPEVETDYYNFESLNIPKDHPARDMQDTFYLEDNKLLRTHTSPMQIRIMENNKPPIKIISPGKVYRCDSDVTHTPMFHQVEGLLVDEIVTFGNLKGILMEFCSRFFGNDTKIRFRPSYFPFTEPSAELDIEWTDKAGDKTWMEVLGCGMVNPKVFEFVGYDSNKFSGLAFGMGIERLAMIKFGITDIRYFYQNDLKFLSQF
ncbi:MAG: phenylalanine--tRNA ligase subunit alpha [Thermodesulfobacteriota bacterium]|nr:phenylalanine--tRNA ligase subunit alpha [Thermodesulfobacteriota bacterium]